MANINLLPWRETRRQARRQQFLTGLCGTAFIAALSVWFWGAVVSNQIAYQEMRNQKLSTQIKRLDQEVAEIRDLHLKRNRLIDRMRVIQALQGNRPVIVRLLDQLVRTVPDGVFYTSVRTDAQIVSIEGIAESNNRVSSLMRRLEASRWMQAPSLDAVQATPGSGAQATHFTLSVGIELPEEAVEQPL